MFFLSIVDTDRLTPESRGSTFYAIHRTWTTVNSWTASTVGQETVFLGDNHGDYRHSKHEGLRQPQECSLWTLLLVDNIQEN